ncbi:hypothetical protein [Bacillus solimangrovi]|uniref:Uncharacterized protein n=1 Tax=Bacillus solimangrovi TaxID=1305675 RepID=A0A1E5LEN1_9BACI|nr:hypothetical protein [Bacillus solimangrovi]OEH92524.1 hypothetical protein BFG57_15420 [Bacillus solimangrovi]
MSNLIALLIMLWFLRLMYLILDKRSPWIFIITTSIIIFGMLYIMGFRLTASSALPMGSHVVESIKTNYGKALIYEDVNNDTFGVAKIERHLGFLYSYDGGGNGDYIREHHPFAVSGYGSDTEDGFLVGVKIAADSGIKYIVIGDHFENLTTSDIYYFNMKTVERYPERYHIKEVNDNYVFFVLDEYSEETWTIRGLDEEGDLVADKLFGSGRNSRYVNW